MSPTPPSTDPSTGARSPEEQFRVVRKRNRVPLSCYPCRNRKLKCDRSQPCRNCTKREGMDTQSCSYATPISRKKNQSQGDSSPDDMQNRIDRLEGLVLSLMHGGANVTAPPSASRDASVSQSVTDSGSSAAKIPNDHETEMVDDEDSDDASDVDADLAASLGVLKVDTTQGKARYFGQEHWHTILGDISEVKQYFTLHKKELETSYERVKQSKPMTAREGPTLLLSAIPASELELRAQLPPKATVATLCGRYFNSMDSAVSIIHGPTFQQQLRTHWLDPSKTPIMWLGMLYSILTLAMLSYHKVGDEPPEWKGRSLEMASQFRLKTVQCLISADYTKPVDYTIETMMLYVFSENSVRWDAELGLWMIVSLIIRIAFRMGYHRDAKWFPSITPFQAEMRRRTWALIRMSDIMFSHQVSLPNMIYDHDCDTQLPNNIFDDEFHPGIKELPPSRPITEPTPIAYMIAKARLCNEAGNVLQATHRMGEHVPYDEILRFDAKLRQIKQDTPPHLKLTPLEGSHDPVTLIIARFNLDILYLKIVCQLHRRYLPRARQNSRYTHSRRTAIEAALLSLGHLITLYRESQGNGRLRSIGWFVKSIATKDFVLPAMLVILDLHFDNLARQQGTDGECEMLYTTEQRDCMLSKLETVKDIWTELAGTSIEAFKASKVVDIMLKKIKDPTEERKVVPGALGTMDDPMTTLAYEALNPAMSMPPDMTAPGTLGDLNPSLYPFAVNPNTFMGMDLGLSPSAMPSFQGDPFGTQQGAASHMPAFNMGDTTGQAPETGSNFDWGAFENYGPVASWGAEQPFSIYGYGADEASPEQQQGSEQRGSSSGGAGSMNM